MKDEYTKAIEESGFEEIRIISESTFLALNKKNNY